MEALELEIDLDASVPEVWKAWTTEEGLRSFLAPACKIEIKPDGPFEIFFFPDNPPGKRGADGQRVMAVEHEKMLSFTWNFPEDLPEIREQRTIVILKFLPRGTGSKLKLIQAGWGDGADWQEGRKYFEYAWGKVVFSRLKEALDKHPA